MNTCWKCGEPTGNNSNECEGCEHAAVEDQIVAALEEMDRQGVRFLQLDWSKVATVAEFQMIVRVLDWHIAIPSNDPRAEVLRKFLKS